MPRLATVLLSTFLLAGCGGGGDEPADRSSTAAPKADQSRPEAGGREPEAEPGGGDSPARKSGPVTADEKAVIRGWSDALRQGDVDRAVRYWRTPAIASNGGAPIRLVSRRAVRFFNDGLACGAKLESVSRDAKYVLATFRLTERKGSRAKCGSGVGNKARTLFLLRDGKIVQWLRATDPQDPAQTPGGSTS